MRYKALGILAACSFSAFLAAAAGAGAEGETLFNEDFNSGAIPSGWQKGTDCPASLAIGKGVDGGNCIEVSVEPGKEVRGGLLSLDLPAEKFKGKAVILEAMVKGENVTKPTQHYLGPKLMLHYKTPDGDVWPDALKRYGSYDWTKASIFARLPDDLQSINIALGLQSCAGKLYIDKLRIVALPQPKSAPLAQGSQTPLQKTPSLRGMMSGGDLSAAALKLFGEKWNANLMRYQISNPKRLDLSTTAQVDAWLAPYLEKLDQALPLFRKYGIKVAIDLHAGPGATQTEILGNKLGWTKTSQDELVRVWKLMASKYKNEPSVWGYDIMNEPSEDNYTGEVPDWNRLVERVAKAIREIDPVKAIIVEPQGGSVESLKTFTPIDVPNVVYSVHFYRPSAFSHQGIYGRAAGVEYPGVIEGKMWDKAAMEQEFAPVVAFQRKYNVPIYIGEFSVARWAPSDSAVAWLRDAIEIFESHGWDWTYHAFREASCWDSEIGSAKEDSVRLESTPRNALLREYFKRNAK